MSQQEPTGPGQNQPIVTKELYDTLAKEVAELKRTIHSMVSLPTSRFTNAPESSIDTIVTGRASTEIQQYEVVMIGHQTIETAVPAVILYDRDTAVGLLYTLGIAMEHSVSGETIRVQVDGISFVRVADQDSAYGSVADRMVRTGIELKPRTGGTTEVLDHDDMESASFIALEDSVTDDSIVLVRILDGRDRYRGPFKGTFENDGTEIIIGIDRGSASNKTHYKYDFEDRITWHLSQNAQLEFLKAGPEPVTIAADNTYVYYKISRETGDITAELIAATVHPNDLATSVDWTYDNWYVVLGKARFAGGKVTAWIQYHYGQINVQDRAQPSFWAELTTRVSPYSWKKINEGLGTYTPTLAGSSNATEVHNLDGIPEGTRVKMWQVSDGTEQYHFACGFGGPGTRDEIGSVDEDESADAKEWDRSNQVAGKFGVIDTKFVRIAWVAGEDAILYAFYRDYNYDSNGNLMAISVETRVAIISINDICDECGPTSTLPPTGSGPPPTQPDPCQSNSGCSVLSGSGFTA